MGRILAVGDPAPYFVCKTRGRPDYAFSTVAGRFVVLACLGPASEPAAAKFLDKLWENRARFDDDRLAFFGVVTGEGDFGLESTREATPGVRFFFDADRKVSLLYGADKEPVTYLLDPGLRVLATLRGKDQFGQLLALLDRLPAMPPTFQALPQAPVMVLPRVFEPGLCKALIEYYEKLGGEDSGYMQERDGKTKGVIDYGMKRRRDREIADEALRKACMTRIHDRLAPEIEKAFQFKVTRMERYIVSCYAAEESGHFRAHRDNTTKGTAHRRFAVSLFLNANDYEGGFLRFPEFGTALYKAPLGGAVVFGCSLLHEATPVTQGKRYMFLPFLYDEAAARIRQQNAPFLDSKDVIRVGEKAPSA